MTHTDPRAAVDALAAAREPYLIGVRHHSPALAAVVPALLDASGADVVCVELPAEFQPWLEHLADPETVAPVALAGTGEDGRLAFYPFADFSPELAAIRWARAAGAAVVCCDLPLSDRGWTHPTAAPTGSPAADSAAAPALGRGADPVPDSVAATAAGPAPAGAPDPDPAAASDRTPALTGALAPTPAPALGQGADPVPDRVAAPAAGRAGGPGPAARAGGAPPPAPGPGQRFP
ncbi:DUF5682 family protein, partial [Streptomyces sp. NPDC059742]|uniref:DUF5682 family protein n=1 Tax=Streptomyces sp. NPDC059742 TaxID=3346927 RepID=UPI0036470A18